MSRIPASSVEDGFGYDERTVRRWAADGCSAAPAILLHLMNEGRLTVQRVAAAKIIMARRLRQALAREHGRIGEELSHRPPD